jgi:glycosyltransferase involved in cell wall biosynthesis
MRQYSRFVQEKAAHLASSVITISQYSKQRIVKRFGIAPSKVVVTPLAPAARFSGSDRLQSGRSVDREYGLRDYILALASASPRKNVDRLLYSYCLLGPAIRSRFSLAITCAHSSIKDRLAQTAAELDIAASTVFLEHVSDEGLVNLMTGAALFVFPSLEEGFGLPPLEAMACGTPVVASNTSSLPEVLGDAALLVPPADAQAIAEAMAAVLSTPSLAAELSERGLARSRQFSWEATARQTLEVYETVLEGVT